MVAARRDVPQNRRGLPDPGHHDIDAPIAIEIGERGSQVTPNRLKTRVGEPPVPQVREEQVRLPGLAVRKLLHVIVDGPAGSKRFLRQSLSKSHTPLLQPVKPMLCRPTGGAHPRKRQAPEMLEAREVLQARIGNGREIEVQIAEFSEPGERFEAEIADLRCLQVQRVKRSKARKVFHIRIRNRRAGQRHRPDPPDFIRAWPPSAWTNPAIAGSPRPDGVTLRVIEAGGAVSTKETLQCGSADSKPARRRW